jgi:hypothetical protein
MVFDDTLFTYFEQSQTSIKRYTSERGSENGDAGFVSLKYKKADVFFDSSGGIPYLTGYSLNTDYMELVVHRDADMTVMDELKAVNQDAVVIPVLWMGNLACSNRFLQATLHT